MEVNGPGSVQRSIPIRQQAPAAAPKTNTPPTAAPRDEVEISSAGRLLDKASQSPEIRAARLAQIKAGIDAGEYETPEKLEAALEKMLGAIRSGRE
jgi:flagellar biosynthesis anti-sigma factor FlgM